MESSIRANFGLSEILDVLPAIPGTFSVKLYENSCNYLDLSVYLHELFAFLPLPSNIQIRLDYQMV